MARRANGVYYVETDWDTFIAPVTISNPETTITTTSSNGTTYETAGDKVFAVLKANAEDLTYLFDGDVQFTPTGKAYGWNITFQNTSEDVFGKL